ncbi:hypothetical protein C8Q76DRAFT_738672 [Earliella scabrosa]|nr:hypothetical protein C8Q76DRAFT_738672 [Earliella scabrosa]
MYLLRLPREILIMMLTRLEAKQVLRCACVCTILRDIVRDSIELQYIIELAADGMVDGIGFNLSTAERLARLLQLRARWRSLEWTRVITISTPVSFQQCVVDGVYASMPEVDNPSRRLTLTCLSSNGDVEVPRVLQIMMFILHI